MLLDLIYISLLFEAAFDKRRFGFVEFFHLQRIARVCALFIPVPGVVLQFGCLFLPSQPINPAAFLTYIAFFGAVIRCVFSSSKEKLIFGGSFIAA